MQHHTPNDNGLPPLVRLCFMPLMAASMLFGPLLLVLPGSTEDYWAWEVRPDMSASWLGAAYSFGAVALAAMLLRGRWVAAAVPVAATLPFAVVMLAATIIHDDRFFTGTLAYAAWLAIYVILPPALLVMLRQGRDYNPPHGPADTLVPRWLRRAFAAAGVLAGLVGLCLVIEPDWLDGSWPWLLTPLMSRVIGGWLLFIATGALAPMVEPRYAAYRFYLAPAALWFTLLFFVSLLHYDDFDKDRVSTPLYFLAVGGASLSLAGVSLYLEFMQRVRDFSVRAALASGRAIEAGASGPTYRAALRRRGGRGPR